MELDCSTIYPGRFAVLLGEVTPLSSIPCVMRISAGDLIIGLDVSAFLALHLQLVPNSELRKAG